MFQGRIPEPKLDRQRLLEERAKLALVASGCQEFITYSLVHPNQPARLDATADGGRRTTDGLDAADRAAPLLAPAPTLPLSHSPTLPSPSAARRPSSAAILVTNPMTVEQSALRQTLLGSLLET